MPHLVAAPDKFRGTATAETVAGAAARAARRCGRTVTELPLADGGEGSLDAVRRAVGGELRRQNVTGPLQRPVDARWLLVGDTTGIAMPAPLVSGDDPTAVIEASEATGRHLLAAPTGDDCLHATSAGVGELVAAALGCGARQVVVFVGGTSTTDGGWGALSALGGALGAGRALSALGGALAAGGLLGAGGARLVVATDVQTRFRTAAAVFGPQKGASPAQVAKLDARLESLADRYRAELRADVQAIDGSGAGGGLAGGLAAIGGKVVAGFPLVASLVDLDRRLERADLVMTGEGCLDATSFAGKVVGGVCDALGGTVPVLCVAGEVAIDTAGRFARRAAPIELVSLAELAGARRAISDTADAVEQAVTASLLARGARPRSRARPISSTSPARRPHA